MKELEIDLENCYGIGSMIHSFSFKNPRTHVIYAANGMMKTSFAKTFYQLSKGEEPKDEVFERIVKCKVLMDSKTIPAESICVIEPYKAAYTSDKMSSLVANSKIRKEYDEVIEGIYESKNKLVKVLAEASKIPNPNNSHEIEKKLSIDFHTYNEKENISDCFLRALVRIENEVSEHNIISDIKYASIFNEKTDKVFEKTEFKETIHSYIQSYEQLLTKSNFFKKGIFNHQGAGEIAKQLKRHGYFGAEHELKLNTGEEIKNPDDLNNFIEKEKQEILSDENLKKNLDKIDKLLTNEDLRKFREYLLEHDYVLAELDNPGLLKQKIWMSYLKDNIELYKDCVKKYLDGKKQLDKIRDAANNDQVKWNNIINIFNDRFNVPFEVSIKNQVAAIVDNTLPEFDFKFFDRADDPIPIERSKMLEVLSQGEKRALYLLDIIYEIEGRKEEKIKTLYIIDDIADSFDYKNKYAIIEYLNELQDEELFNQIILTHNFDFYRTVSNRLDVVRKCKWHATKKTETGKVTLKEEKYQNNPLNTWKDNWHFDDKQFIASIPLAREISNFIGSDVELLNQALHYNHNSHDGHDSLKTNKLREELCKIMGKQDNKIDQKDELWLTFIDRIADSIVESDDVSLEEKVSLSIAIRLKAEEYMVTKLGGDATKDITKNQTRALINKFKKQYCKCKEAIEILDRVGIMTPEAIHLNSFMYEPILDMSGDHLIKLYKDVKALF